MKILIVHDTQSMQMFVTRSLRQLDEVEEVTRAEGVESALKLLGEQPVDLVLSDWNLGYGEIGGLELLRAIRGAGLSIRFGFITAESSDDVRERARLAGADFVIAKPFSLSELARAIREDAPLERSDLGEGMHGPFFSDTLELSRAEQIADLLSRLCGTQVDVKRSRKGPDPHVSRYVGLYCDEHDELAAMCEFEICGAAAVSGAMHRWSAKVTGEWARSGTLPDSLFDHFYEAANVLAQLVRPDGSRALLCRVEGYAPSEPIRMPSSMAIAKEHFSIEVKGYGTALFSLAALSKNVTNDS